MVSCKKVKLSCIRNCRICKRRFCPGKKEKEIELIQLDDDMIFENNKSVRELPKIVD